VLRSREKVVLAMGAAAAALILLFAFLVIPGISRVRSLARASEAAEKELAELRTMRPELTRLDREVRRKMGQIAAAANTSASSLSRLTAAVQEAGFPQSAVSIKSGATKTGEFVNEEAFDLKVENITYLEAIQLLKRLEGGTLPLAVRTVNLKSRYDDSRYLDATLRIGFLAPAAR
jgi:general secretion pathway protein M